jgi:hypothetical protein
MSEPVPSLEAIARRLDRLERQNRRLRLALVGLLAAAAALAVGQASTGQAQPGAPEARVKVVDAERFVVRDQNGKARAALFMDNRDPDNRHPRLVLYDENGKGRLGMSVQRHGPDIAAWHADHSSALGLYVQDKDRSVAMTLFDKSGARVHLAHMGGTPQLKLLDGTGKPALSLTASQNGPGIALNDPTGRRRAQLEVDAQKAALTLFGGNNLQKHVTGIDTFGQPVK